VPKPKVVLVISLLGRDFRNRPPLAVGLSYLADNDDMLLLNGIDAINLSSRPSDDLIPLAARCLSNADALTQIVQKAQKAGSLTVLPSIGRGSDSRLAHESERRLRWEYFAERI
jgi:hypothetical protein